MYSDNVTKILAVGETGAGKSFLLNALTGQNDKFKVYHTLCSGTQNT